MTDLFDLLDDDDRITLARYQPMTNRGIDRILTRLKAMAEHPSAAHTPLTIHLPPETVGFLQATHPDQYQEVPGHTGAILNAATRAAKASR